jgi:hypothetical protein
LSSGFRRAFSLYFFVFSPLGHMVTYEK